MLSLSIVLYFYRQVVQEKKKFVWRGSREDVEANLLHHGVDHGTDHGAAEVQVTEADPA